MASGGEAPLNGEGSSGLVADVPAMSNQEFDEAVAEMHAQIHKQIAEISPLVGEKEQISCLLQEYADDDAVYQRKICMLSDEYSHIRRMRGDGNCFYRAFGYGYLEQLLSNKTDAESFKKKATDAKDNLEKLGYPSFTLEDFHDQFVDIVEETAKGMPPDELLRLFRDDGISNYVVVFLRLITSSHLQQNFEFFQNFVDEGRTIQDFCKVEVEPMDRESDHIHIIALTEALQVSVRVAYVDRADEGRITFHDFPENSRPHLHLLYRPGHYDVIYPK